MTKRTKGDGEISVKEAGRLGGEKTKAKHGQEFYQAIGRKGGQKVRDLIKIGHQTERGGE